MKKVLVLGGAGYIGSHAVCALIDSGAAVVVVDNLETGFRQAVHPEAVFYEGDIRDAAFLDDVFSREEIDAVIHFAANSLVGESVADPLKYYGNNVGGTCCLLDAMIRHDVNHIVFSSTAAVYGDPAQIMIPENARTMPSNPYGETKLAMERMFHWTEQAHGIRYVSLRYFNACGAHESGQIGEAHNPETHLIPIVLQVASGLRENISVFGHDYDTPDGTCVRDYIHVMDLAEAHILAMDYLLDGGQSDIFNLGNGVGFTVSEVIKAAERVVERLIPVNMAARRPGDPARLVASSQKALHVLGWEPAVRDLEAMVETAWRWHRTHPCGFAGDAE